MANIGQARTVSQVLGEMTWLLSQSPSHRDWRISSLEILVMPAILLGQFRLFYDDKQQPIAFATWALVSEAVNRKIESDLTAGRPFDLPLEAWTSGNIAWLLDLVSCTAALENGLVQKLVGQLQATVFKDRELHVLHTAPPLEAM